MVRKEISMAITSNITFSPSVVEYIDEPENNKIRKMKKKLYIDGSWEDAIFIIITDNTKNRNDIQTWLRDHYGPSQYAKTWWSTFTSVCMLDKIYTHWKLCE